MKGCERHMEAHTFEASCLGFGLCCYCLVSLTQAMEETSIGRRPPSDWHVVKCMGIFFTNN